MANWHTPSGYFAAPASHVASARLWPGSRRNAPSERSIMNLPCAGAGSACLGMPASDRIGDKLN